MEIDTKLILEEWERIGMQIHTLPNAAGMWTEELEYLAYLCGQCDFNKNWVEIGSFCGSSACLMNLVRESKENPGTGKIISVDLDFKPMFDININRLSYQNLNQKLEINSSDFANKYRLQDWSQIKSNTTEISFAFIDGFHSYQQVITDFEQVLPFLSKDAIVAFHDASPFMFDDGHKDHCHSEGGWEMGDGIEDFRVDEAIFDILMDHKDFELMQRPPEYDCEHFQETGLTEWVRGTTSPFNSLVAIRKIGTKKKPYRNEGMAEQINGKNTSRPYE